MIKIEVIEGCVSIGEFKSRSDRYQPFSRWQDLCEVAVGVERYNKFMGLDAKSRNMALTDYMGITPTKALKLYNAVEWKTKCLPYLDYLNKYARGKGGKISSRKFIHAMKAKDKVEQAEEDGIKNVIPFILNYNLSPTQLKKYLGKGLWKSLCKNSYSRNKLICQKCYNNYEVLHTHGIDSILQEIVARLNSVPSTLIPVVPLRYQDSEVYKFIVSSVKKTGLPLYRVTSHDFGEALWLVNDTEHMAHQLGKIFVLQKDMAYVKRKHDEFMEEINKKEAEKYSKEPYKILEDIQLKEYDYNGYHAHLIGSPCELYQEGSAMHHCVAAHSDTIENGEYLVYSISKGGKRSSTLGIGINKNFFEQTSWSLNPEIAQTKYLFKKEKMFSFSQHYAACNGHVADEDEKQIAEDIIKTLNEHALIKLASLQEPQYAL